MKKLLLFLVLSCASAFGQGAQRIAVAQVNSQGYAKILSGAAITVCSYNINLQCISPVTVYQDPYLMIPEPTPFYADANGNYSYYVSPVAVYLEQVSSPGAVPQVRPITFGVAGSSSVSVNGTIIASPNFNSASPSPDAGYIALPFKVSGSSVIVEAPFGSPPVIGGVVPNNAFFNNLTISGTCTGCGTTDWGSPGAIGSVVPNTGAFTNLTSQAGALNGTLGLTTPNQILATELDTPSIGGNTPGAATFTNVTLTNLTVGGTCTGCSSINLASPPPIGNTTPNTGAFTTLAATGLTISSIPTLNSAGELYAGLACNSGTPTSSTFCNGVGAWALPPVQAARYISPGTCMTAASDWDICSSTFTIPIGYPGVNYAVACSMNGVTGYPVINQIVKSSGSITVYISNGSAAAGIVSYATELDCVFSGNY